MPHLFQPPHPLNAAPWRNLRVGLLGGSFNPPHDGHLHISTIALNALNLDCVWWLVSPQNPLKGMPAPYETRIRQCEALTGGHPRILVSDLERHFGTARTYDTLTALLPRFPATEFVFLTGFDNALSFHRWHRWRGILDLVATAHIARPPALSLVQQCPLRNLETQNHIVVQTGGNYRLLPNTSFWVKERRMNRQSSTLLRAKSS